MLVLPVLDDHDNLVGYFVNGQIVDELPKSRKGLFGKSDPVTVSTEQAYIIGRGIVSLAFERMQWLHRQAIQDQLRNRLDNDPFTRSLNGIIE